MAAEQNVVQSGQDILQTLMDAGPFGWVGIAFACCIVAAGLVNWYLNCQKKKAEVQPGREELEKLAPGAFMDTAPQEHGSGNV